MTSQDEQWLLEEKYEGEKSDAFFADLKRLQAGEPLGYVIGFVPFLGCKIWLDSHPLIPRPETEFWVEKAVAAINRSTQATNPTSSNDRGSTPVIGDDNTYVGVRPLHILDLCAGSGCIGVVVAKHIPVARVDFAEIDARHLPTIKKNLSENNINPERINVWQSDLFSNVPNLPSPYDQTPSVLDGMRGAGELVKEPYRAYGEETTRTRNEAVRQNKGFLYDFILTNPPYIDPALDRTEPSVKDFEPHHALYGGQDGLEFIKHIIATAPSFLNPHGQLWIEHEPEQTEAIHRLAEKSLFTATTHTDQYYVERYSILTLQS